MADPFHLVRLANARVRPTLVRVACGKGVSAYVGDGTNRWPAVQRLEAARLFLLASVTAPAGSTLHAVADEGVQLRAVAEVIGRHLDLPVAPISPGDAQEHFSFLAGLLALDSPASSALTRELVVLDGLLKSDRHGASTFFSGFTA